MIKQLYFVVPVSTFARIILCVLSNNAYCGNWTFNPFVQLQETYSDNLKLARPGNELGGFVTEINPRLSVSRQSGHNTLNLNYRLQNLYNAAGSNEASTFNQLFFNANHVLVPNKFYVIANSSINQQNISNTRIANDNISGSGNRTNVNTFSISPNWTPHFGNFANGSVRINYDTLSTDSITNTGTSSISDTQNLGEIIQLTSGTEFKRVNWNISFNNRDNFRANGQDISFQNTSALIRTHLNKHFNVFVQSGYSDNNLQSLRNNVNGFFYTVGGQWTPSRFYSIEAGGGNNNHITLSLNPMRRLSWVTTFRDNQIGLNSGQTWQTVLNYKALRSNWSITHRNDTTTTQALLLQQQTISIDINPDPFIDQFIDLPQFYLSLTDQVIVTKTWNFLVRFSTGKSNIALSAFSQDRTFQATDSNEKVNGITGNWNWQFSRKTSAYITPRWQQIDRKLQEKDNRLDFAVGLNQSITNRLNGRLEFRHLNQSSAISSNNFEENRATASLFLRF